MGAKKKTKEVEYTVFTCDVCGKEHSSTSTMSLCVLCHREICAVKPCQAFIEAYELGICSLCKKVIAKHEKIINDIQEKADLRCEKEMDKLRDAAMEAYYRSQ
jgi:ribosomal protein S14